VGRESVAAWERRRVEAGLSSTRPHTVTHEVTLPQTLEGRMVQIIPTTVTVHVTLVPRKKIYDLDLAVTFLTPPGSPCGRASTATAVTQVFLSVGAGDRRAAAGAGVHRPDAAEIRAGLHLEPLRLQLPKDFQVVGTPPRQVPFRLDVPDAPPAAPVQQTLDETRHAEAADNRARPDGVLRRTRSPRRRRRS
jgi:hypothetical protein